MNIKEQNNLTKEIARNNNIRPQIIQPDDIINLRIVLGNTDTIDEFLKEIGELCKQ